MEAVKEEAAETVEAVDEAVEAVKEEAEAAADEVAEAVEETAGDILDQGLELIGELTGENDIVIALTNSTGKDIEGISYRLAGTKKYGENLLAEGALLANGETKLLVVSLETEEEAEYDVRLAFADNKSSQLHAFPFFDAEKAEILLEDGVAYLKYESLASKEAVDTLEAEKTAREAEMSKKAEGTVSASAPAAPAQDQSSYTESNASSEQPAYYYEEEPAYYYYEEEESSYDYSGTTDGGGTDTGAAPQEECLTGGILF